MLEGSWSYKKVKMGKETQEYPNKSLDDAFIDKLEDEMGI